MLEETKMLEGNKKYELVTDEYIAVYGNKKLYRIRALKDFGKVRAGDLGGYVESESNLSHGGSCWIYDDARVIGRAQAGGEARIGGDAWVTGYAQIDERAQVDGRARVNEGAHVAGDARITGEAWVTGTARVDDRATVRDRALVDGRARVSKSPIFISGLYYNVTITDTHIQVGCQCKTLEEWKSMTLEDLETSFGYKAVEFHNKYWKIIEHLAIGHQRQR